MFYVSPEPSTHFDPERSRSSKVNNGLYIAVTAAMSTMGIITLVDDAWLYDFGPHFCVNMAMRCMSLQSEEH